MTYDPSTPLAMTLVFHGAGGDSATAAAFGIQNAPGAGNASIFVFPQGIQFQGFGVGWDDSCHGYDMVFFDHMVSNLGMNYCIDEKKIFVAGFSWGGDFATALLCCRGDRIRGAAVASSTDEYASASDYLTYYNLTNGKCPVINNAAIRFTHAASGDGAYPAPLFGTTSQLFRMLNACSSKLTAGPSPCLSFGGCKQSYLECVYPGLGHSTPTNWSVDTWNFFADLR
jgi:polyhydroxybutyrate depolymerase